MRMIGVTCEGCGKTLLDCLEKCNRCGRPYSGLALKVARAYQAAKVHHRDAELASVQVKLAGAAQRFGGKVPKELIERSYGIQ